MKGLRVVPPLHQLLKQCTYKVNLMRNQLKDLGRLKFELEKDDTAAQQQPGDAFPAIATYHWQTPEGLAVSVVWRTFQSSDGSYGVIPQGTPPIGYDNVTNEYVFQTWIEAVSFIKRCLPCDSI
jgi:hypothetical protein